VVSVAMSKAGSNGEGLKYLGVFPQLRELDLKDLGDADTQLIRLKSLGWIKELSLDRSSSTDAGMKHLQGLVGLETLTFGSTAVGDEGMKSLMGVKNLRWLEIGGHRRLTNAGLAVVRDLTQLQRLYLHRTRVTDAGLTHLDQLTEMRTSMLPKGITDAGIEHLKGMTKLTFLEATDSPIMARGISVLRGLKHLDSLYRVRQQFLAVSWGTPNNDPNGHCT